MKAYELEELFIHYFPILLKGRLKDKYYKHFLLLVYGIKTLSNKIIHKKEIDHAEFLIDEFFKDLERLYNKNKCTYNSHIATHISQYVRLYGATWNWSTYPFEDMNGFIKSMTHGKINLDKEIVNTIKICNAQVILKYLLHSNEKKGTDSFVKGKNIDHRHLTQSEKNVIVEYCDLHEIDFDEIRFHTRASLTNQIFTSERYQRQKKRDNSQISWKEENDDVMKFGVIQLFCNINRKISILVQELIPCNDNCNLFDKRIKFEKIHMLVRESNRLCLIEEKQLFCKIIRVGNYLCIPEYTGKK